jgi:mono/diheme cytochrome c family protein
MRACGFLNANPGSQLHIQYCGSLMRNPEVTPTYFVALLVAVVLLYCVAPRTRAQTPQNRGSQATASPGTNSTQIARGKYIVEGLAMCGMCHTPRTDSGEIDQGRWLDGAALWLLPAHPSTDWPLKAPRLAGSPAASDEELVRLLTTGVWKTGNHLRSPMPQFRMSQADAEAVVAYLRSLTPHAGD